MKCHHDHQAILFPLAAAVILLCVSCQKGPLVGDRAAERNVGVDKCLIDLASPQPCTLSKIKDDRVVWINNSSAPVFVCFDPNNDPFEAYAWDVPANDKRRSGSISAGVNPPPGGTLTYYFVTSSTYCVPPSQSPKTNPKIIIGQ
jgi:hypothetical protein